MTWQVYDLFRHTQNNGGGVDLDTPGGNGFKVALLTASYSINQNTDQFWDDISANEITGTDYTALGNVCSSPTFGTPNGAGLITFDAANPAAWIQNTGSAFTDARIAVLLHDTGTASTSRLVCYEDMTSDRSNAAGPFSITFAAAGIFTLPRA